MSKKESGFLENFIYHINAKKGEIAKYVLMPGDPLRAKFMAYRYLDDFTLVSNVRNMLMFTGTYKGVRVTIASSGMGCGSMSIYAYELYKFFDVQFILRLGSTGSYVKEISSPSVINVKTAYGQKFLAKEGAGLDDVEKMDCDQEMHELIKEVAKENNIKIYNRDIYSNYLFHFYDPKRWEHYKNKFNVSSVEMETFTLLLHAHMFNRKAASILTVVDSYMDEVVLDWKYRERGETDMMELGLESMIKYANKNK